MYILMAQTEKDGSIGAGMHCRLFSFYASLGRDHAPFDAEVRAILIALK